MKQLIEAFTTHLRQAMTIRPVSEAGKSPLPVGNVLIIGMGGSGIGGYVATQVLQDDLSVPVSGCRDYSIPSFVSPSSLVIASSYSGDTEETLAALAEAAAKGAKIICLCSGGKLEKEARTKGYGLTLIPGGLPPRAALGYSLPQLFRIFHTEGLTGISPEEIFPGAIDLLEKSSHEIKKQAKSIAEKICNKNVVIYSQSDFEAVSVRFRQQLNENSKKLCWHHVFPEMNHNELVGWRSSATDKAVILLRNKTDKAGNKKRMELSKEIFAKYNPEIIEIFSAGKNKLEQSLYLIHLCDWISVYVAELNGIDPMEIKVINYLKGELARE